jgi:hypothetical protein
VARWAEINDGQTAVSDKYIAVAVLPDPTTIRTTMVKSLKAGVESFASDRRPEETEDSTHGSSLQDPEHVEDALETMDPRVLAQASLAARTSYGLA